MPKFQIIKEPAAIHLSKEWTESAKFSGKDTIVNRNGRTPPANHQGRLYRLVAKMERKMPLYKRIARIFLGTAAILATLFIALRSDEIIKLFSKDKEAIRFAVPLEKMETALDTTSPMSAPAKKDWKEVFRSVQSGKLKTFETPAHFKLKSRKDFFRLAENGYQPPPPVLSKSTFVPEAYVSHLMCNKKDLALGAKYNEGDAITNMEGALHTFLTPLAKVNLTADYAWKDTHSCSPFGKNHVREVILSAAIQPDFEYETVIASLTEITDKELVGEPLPAGFRIPAPEEKKDPQIREAYELQLRKHMIYHLTAEHRLPAAEEILLYDVMSYHKATHLLEILIKGNLEGGDWKKMLQSKFLISNGKVHSMEMLFNTYLHQLRNEFAILEQAATQGYVYTINPPSIFAAYFGDATLLNRLQILAFHQLKQELPLKHLKMIGFSDYQDQKAIPLLEIALPGVPVTNKDDAYAQAGEYALVIHNNSDAFGQNIEFEGPSSLDGVIGSYSDAALVLKRDREDLLDHIYSASDSKTPI